MNIDDITIKQARELTAMFGGSGAEKNSLAARSIGKKAIVRSRNEGVNFGEIVAADETGIILKNARRLWYTAQKATAWYEGVCNDGLGAGSKLSASVLEKTIIEDYSITICTAESIASIEGWPAHEG